MEVFPENPFPSRKANEYLGGDLDSQNCRDFLHAYLIDVSTEDAEDGTWTPLSLN
jgi:hypothetical protein